MIRSIIDRATDHLQDPGHLLLEVGHTQAEAVAQLMSDAGLQSRTCADLAGIPRIVIGRHASD